jgi:hypothetical protein
LPRNPRYEERASKETHSVEQEDKARPGGGNKRAPYRWSHQTRDSISKTENRVRSLQQLGLHEAGQQTCSGWLKHPAHGSHEDQGRADLNGAATAFEDAI